MKNPLLVPELREFIETGKAKELREFCESCHPAAAAEFLSPFPAVEAWEVLRRADSPLRAEIFSHLEEELQVELASTIERDEIADILSHMSPDDRVDLFKRMPEEKQELILPALAQAEREDIRRLSAYEEGTVGAVMTSDYATLSPDLSAGRAIERLRREAPDKETIYYAYVVDENRKLIGFVSLKDLILAPPFIPVSEIMHREVIFARAGDDQEEAARKIQKYDLLALPVINGDGALVGIITHDDAIDIIIQEQTEDMEKLMAIGGAHEVGAYLRTSAFGHFKNRFVWIVVLAVLGLLSGYIVQSFEGILLQFAILATFMPMLADTGGNAGSQSATLVVRALALKEITPRDLPRILFKELMVSLPLGLLLALLAFGRVVLFAGGSHMPAGFSVMKIGVAVGTALCIQVVTSTLIGALLPLGASRLKLDPAVVASPALTTIVDITGLFIYFMTAKAMLGL